MLIYMYYLYSNMQSAVSAADFYWEYAILILWADGGNKVCVQLCLTIWKEIGAKLDIVPWYVPKLVETSHEGEVTILWLQQMETDRTISNNKPGIIICYNEKEHDVSLTMHHC
jgi:hypothetical protein